MHSSFRPLLLSLPARLARRWARVGGGAFVLQGALVLSGALMLSGARAVGAAAGADSSPKPAPPSPQASTPPAPAPANPKALSAPASASPSTSPAAPKLPASPAQKELQRIITRQQLALAKAAEDNPKFDENQFKREMQDICYAYDDYLKKYPETAAGYAAYGYLLTKLDMRKQAAALLLKANQLDGNLPLVKNQLGNLLAEDGKPLEAVNYYLAAIKLDPKEPLYHYQLGTLLTEARDEFIKSGEWPRTALDRAMHEAFRQAATLAPHRIEFTYRFAESFYDLEQPDWEAALKAWGDLERTLAPGVERDTARLHAANILIKQNRLDHARAMLALVTAEALQKQKEKLVAQLDEKQKK